MTLRPMASAARRARGGVRAGRRADLQVAVGLLEQVAGLPRPHNFITRTFHYERFTMSGTRVIMITVTDNSSKPRTSPLSTGASAAPPVAAPAPAPARGLCLGTTALVQGTEEAQPVRGCRSRRG
jgi:hypothetical protein